MAVVWRGLDDFARKLVVAGANAEEALANGLYQQAEQIMAVAKADYVPVDTGALRASGYVVSPRHLGGGWVEVELGFGGPAAPYAVIVHEDLTAHHPVGQAKYLETPLKAATQGMLAVLRQHANDAVRAAFQRLGRIERRLARAAAR